MNRFIFSVLLLSILAVTTVGITILPSVYADKTIVNKCTLDTDTGTCSFDQVFKSKKQNFKVINEIDASAIATAIANSSGGGGTGGTVDQVARDKADAAQGRANDAFNLASNASSDVTTNTEDIAELLKTDINHTGEISKLWDAVNEALTDIEGGNQSGPEPPGPVEPPVDNGTIPPIDNGTTTEPPIDNGTGTIPPIDNGTTTEPPVDNGTGTIPPVDNGTGTLPPVDNGTGTIPEEDGFEPQ